MAAVVQLISAIVIILAIIIGSIGNAAVICIVAMSKNLHKQTFYFIANLAIADLVMVGLCMPLNLIGTVIGDGWQLGNIMCKFTLYLVYSSLAESCFSLALISWHRFVMIAYPLKAKTTIFSKRKVIGAIIATWVISFGMCFPAAIANKSELRVVNNKSVPVCGESWQSVTSERLFWTFSSSFYFLVVVNLLIAYILIVYQLWSKRVPGNSLTCMEKEREARKWRTLKMIFAVVILFIVSWMPYAVMKLKSVYSEPEDKPSSTATGLGILFGCLNSVINPIIYAVLNVRMRKAFSKLFCGWMTRVKKTTGGKLKLKKKDSQGQMVLDTTIGASNSNYSLSSTDYLEGQAICNRKSEQKSTEL